MMTSSVPENEKRGVAPPATATSRIPRRATSPIQIPAASPASAVALISRTVARIPALRYATAYRHAATSSTAMRTKITFMVYVNWPTRVRGNQPI